MKCVVIGGGGFIGSHLCEALLKEGHDVTIFDRKRTQILDSLEKKGATLSIGDFFNLGDLQRSLVNQDIVFHLLSTSVPQTSIDDPSHDVEANIIGTLRLLDLARKARVSKIVFTSSGGTVYGIPQEIPIKENHPTNPISSYGITKLTIEKYLHLYWILYGLDYFILRVANAYGERQRSRTTQGVIPVFLEAALQNNEIIVWGNGSVIRDYIFVNDVTNALLRALTYSGDTKVFNISSGEGHSINDVIHVIEGVIERPLRVKYTNGRPFDVPVSVLDITQAKKHLNWTPTIGLFEGIARMHDWMSKYHKD